MGESWPDTKPENLDALHNLGVQLTAARDLDELKERLVDSIIHLTGAARAGVIQFEQPAGDWGVVMVGATGEGTASGEFSEQDRSLISEAVAIGHGVVIENPIKDNASTLVPPHNVMVTPLKVQSQVAGAMYAENIAGRFDDEDLKLFETVALLASSIIENFRLREALATENQEKNKFVSLVTHQVRIPLTSVSGYADLLLGNVAGPLNDRQTDFLSRIKRNADRMSVLVRDLSDITRLESGRMQLELTSFDLSETVSSVVASLVTAFEARKQEFLIDVGDEASIVCADRSSVRRILKNLLDNASRYTPQGGRIAVRIKEAGDFVRIEVSDSGIGISEEDQSRLFTPFFRSEDSDVREYAGWGLGLVVARRLVEAQGGEITWTSEPGKGSVFAFSVPLAGTGIC